MGQLEAEKNDNTMTRKNNGTMARKNERTTARQYEGVIWCVEGMGGRIREEENKGTGKKGRGE